jgi:hypothetical protein
MRVLAICDGSAYDDRVHVRGSHKALGDVVPRHFLEAISGAEQPSCGPNSGRLALAERLLADSDPFPARVMVNRVWHHLFGRGIVATVDNFGVLGEPPSHPELLDYLADRFRRDGWSTKRLIKSLAMSRTYRMASVGSPVADAADPGNVLLHRMPIRRLESEAIRDAILAVSGRFDPALFGPSVDPHLTPFMEGRGRPASGPLDGAGRRSIYIRVRRNFLSPMMLAYDMPTPFNAAGRRSVSNVPAQALILLNDPFVVEQMQVWGRALAKESTGVDERITGMYLRAFARPPDSTELAAAREFLARQAEALGVPADQIPGEARLWADLGHALVNVKQFIYIQ